MAQKYNKKDLGMNPHEEYFYELSEVNETIGNSELDIFTLSKISGKPQLIDTHNIKNISYSSKNKEYKIKTKEGKEFNLDHYQMNELMESGSATVDGWIIEVRDFEIESQKDDKDPEKTIDKEHEKKNPNNTNPEYQEKTDKDILIRALRSYIHLINDSLSSMRQTGWTEDELMPMVESRERAGELMYLIEKGKHVSINDKGECKNQDDEKPDDYDDSYKAVWDRIADKDQKLEFIEYIGEDKRLANLNYNQLTEEVRYQFQDFAGRILTENFSSTEEYYDELEEYQDDNKKADDDSLPTEAYYDELDEHEILEFLALTGFKEKYKDYAWNDLPQVVREDFEKYRKVAEHASQDKTFKEWVEFRWNKTMGKESRVDFYERNNLVYTEKESDLEFKDLDSQTQVLFATELLDSF